MGNKGEITMYVGTDDIKRLVDNALGATSVVPDDDNLPIEFGILRGYLYAIQDILTKEKD